VEDVPADGRGWDWMIYKVPSNPNRSTSLWLPARRCIPGCPGGCCKAKQPVRRRLLDLAHSRCRSLQPPCCIPAALWICLFRCLIFCIVFKWWNRSFGPVEAEAPAFAKVLRGERLSWQVHGLWGIFLCFRSPALALGFGLVRSYMGCSAQKR